MPRASVDVPTTTLARLRLGTDTVDTRTELLDPLDSLERSSLDYYAAVRSLYRQRRASLIDNRDRPMAELAK